MVSNKKTLRKIIDETFLISEEKKQFNNEYIINTAEAQAPSMLLYLFKLIYLLPKEAQQQDKNHWKHELSAVLLTMLSNLGKIKDKKLIISAFERGINNGYKKIASEIKSKYYSLFNIKDLTLDLVKDIGNDYFEKIATWLFTSYKNVLNNTLDPKEATKKIVNELFE